MTDERRSYHFTSTLQRLDAAFNLVEIYSFPPPFETPLLMKPATNPKLFS